MTPRIPQWIKDFRLSGYVNAYGLLPQETRLFGTESLYGDWNGSTLLLAKDFAPSEYLTQRISAGENQPYSHQPKRRTNKRLAELSRHLQRSDHAATCGILYGSALVCLLRGDGKWSGKLKRRNEAIEFGSRVMGEFVIPNMPSLRRIVCMGDEAWQCMMRLAQSGLDFAKARGGGTVVKMANIRKGGCPLNASGCYMVWCSLATLWPRSGNPRALHVRQINL